MWPHWEHCRLVYAGSTYTTGTPGPLGLVLDVLAKLVEAPRMQVSPLVLTEPYPVSDAREVFQGDTGAGAPPELRLGGTPSGFDDGLGDDVVDVGGVPGFLTGALLQQALGGLGALGLELLAQIELSLCGAGSGRARQPGSRWRW